MWSTHHSDGSLIYPHCERRTWFCSQPGDKHPHNNLFKWHLMSETIKKGNLTPNLAVRTKYTSLFSAFNMNSSTKQTITQEPYDTLHPQLLQIHEQDGMMHVYQGMLMFVCAPHRRTANSLIHSFVNRCLFLFSSGRWSSSQWGGVRRRIRNTPWTGQDYKHTALWQAKQVPPENSHKQRESLLRKDLTVFLNSNQTQLLRQRLQ